MYFVLGSSFVMEKEFILIIFGGVLNQHTPTRASGDVVLIRWLQSALIPFVTTQASGY